MQSESTSPLPTRSRSSSAISEDVDFGLGDILTEPESPLPPPFSFATYTPPESSSSVLNLPNGGQLVLRLVGSHPLWGHHLWNTARVLTDYLVRHPELMRRRRICELGAGAGLPSIVAALDGAEKVVVTDYPDESLIENLRWNGDTNVPGENRQILDVQGYLWGHDPKPLLNSLPLLTIDCQSGQGFDLLLLSDLVFNHSQHPALIKSVNALIPPQRNTTDLPPCVLIFITHHRPHLADADMAFLSALADSSTGWAYTRVVEEYTGAMFETDPGEEKIRGTVHGFKAWRIQDGEAKGEHKAS